MRNPDQYQVSEIKNEKAVNMGKDLFRDVSITVLIPTLNEGKNMELVLPKIPSFVSEVLVVDGHSTDDTVKSVKECMPEAKVIYQPGKGKGDALRYGMKNASGDIIVTLDADGSMDPGEIPDFVMPILEGYDFVKGSRFLAKGGTSDMPWYRKMANRGFVALVFLLFGARYTDLCYGYNALHRRVLDKVEFVSDGFEIETEMHIKVKKHHLKVTEVPSFEASRIYGAGKLRTFKDGWRILKTIIRERFND